MFKCTACGSANIEDDSLQLDKEDGNYSYKCGDCGQRFKVSPEEAVRCCCCNSRRTCLTQVTEQEFIFYCNQCDGDFEIERT